MKSQVFKLAWQFFKQTGESFSECLKRAWKNIKLKAALKTKTVRFYFQKVDGTIREAWGTLRDEIIEDKLKGDKRATNPTIQVYFDTEKEEFRCFKKYNLVRVEF